MVISSLASERNSPAAKRFRSPHPKADQKSRSAAHV
jgi:hypothetical protein